MIAQLFSDIASLWAKYGRVYLTGIGNTLILAVTATLIGCVIGFICGILSTNFDVGTVFIDAFLKLCHADLDKTEPVVNVLAELSKKNDVNFVLSLSADPEDIPDYLKQYLI